MSTATIQSTKNVNPKKEFLAFYEFYLTQRAVRQRCKSFEYEIAMAERIGVTKHNSR